MAAQSLSASRVLRFFGRLWLVWFKAALCVSLLSFMASVVQIAVSQELDEYEGDYMYPEYGSGDLFANDTPNCTFSNISTNCSDLPANPQCLNCTFNFDCTYGNDTTVECTVQEDVECKGNKTFSRTFMCQYCYQLEESDYCCTGNTSCNARQTPAANYIANCTAKDSVTCLPPRAFQKQMQCRYSNGYRWSTAILLSFTLGGFGVDRFYLELWGSAIGKLVSFGGLGVWSILDIILIGTGYVGPADGSVYVY